MTWLRRYRVLLIFLIPVIAGCGLYSPPAWNAGLLRLVSQVRTPAAPEPAVVGDAAHGETLFQTFQPVAGIACSTCHRVDSDEQLIGPGLLHVRERASSRVEGLDAEDYVRQSILDPGAYVVEGYGDIMPKNWHVAFSDEDVDDLVAYLLSLSDTPTA